MLDITHRGSVNDVTFFPKKTDSYPSRVFFKGEFVKVDCFQSLHHEVINGFGEHSIDTTNNLNSNLRLSSQEKKVLIFAANGNTSIETSKSMHISVDTVNFHIKNTLLKLKSKNKTQAVAKCILLRLFD